MHKNETGSSYIRFGDLDQETALTHRAEAIGLVDIFQALSGEPITIYGEGKQTRFI